jgi:hypothetical protein
MYFARRAAQLFVLLSPSEPATAGRLDGAAAWLAGCASAAHGRRATTMETINFALRRVATMCASPMSSGTQSSSRVDHAAELGTRCASERSKALPARAP